MSGEKRQFGNRKAEIPTAGKETSKIERPSPNIQSDNYEPRDEMLTKTELAAKLKVSVRTIENWQRDGFVPYLKISCVVLFHWPEVLEHLKANFKVCCRGVVTPRN